MIKILITGAGGGLGRAVYKKLSQTHSGIHILTPLRQELDLLDKSSVEMYFRKHKPTHILHLASVVFGLQGNMFNQMKALSENTRINDNLFLAAQIIDAQYIFYAGTVASYPFPYLTIPLVEEDFFSGLPHEGEFGYAMSKRQAYAYLKLLEKENGTQFNYGIFTNLYGSNDRFNQESGHVIPSLIMKAYAAKAAHKPLSVWGSGEATRDFLHFDDAAEAIVICLEGQVPIELVNIASGMPVTIGQVARSIANAAGIEQVEFQPEKPTGIPRREVDICKIWSCGFRSHTKIDEGLASTYRWYAHNQDHIRN